MVNERLAGLENTYTTESERMRGELSRLRGAEEDAKNKGHQVTSLLEELEKLRKELSSTQKEKKTIEDWAQNYRSEMEKVRKGPQLYLWSRCSVVLRVCRGYFLNLNLFMEIEV